MEVKLNKVSFFKDNDKIINGVDLTLEDKKVTTIMSNDSVVLNSLVLMISDLETPEFGELIHSKDKYEIGVSFSNPEEMFFCNTVREEIDYNQSSSISVEDLFKNFNLDESLLDLNPFLLSEGEKRIVGIIIAINLGKDLVVLENPTYGLDSKNKDNLIKVLKRLTLKEGKTILISTNDSEFALRVSNNVVIINKGQTLLSGPKFDILSNAEDMNAAGLKVPNILEFVDLVKKKKDINLGYRDELNDLMKDVFRNAN